MDIQRTKGLFGPWCAGIEGWGGLKNLDEKRVREHQR